jgi:hypothetical protein
MRSGGSPLLAWAWARWATPDDIKANSKARRLKESKRNFALLGLTECSMKCSS